MGSVLIYSAVVLQASWVRILAWRPFPIPFPLSLPLYFLSALICAIVIKVKMPKKQKQKTPLNIIEQLVGYFNSCVKCHLIQCSIFPKNCVSRISILENSITTMPFCPHMHTNAIQNFCQSLYPLRANILHTEHLMASWLSQRGKQSSTDYFTRLFNSVSPSQNASFPLVVCKEAIICISICNC